MESDSTLLALILAVSALILAICEAGATAIAVSLQSASYYLPSNDDSPDRGSLDLIARLPGGPNAPLKLAGMAAFGVALIAAALIFVSGGDATWGVLVLSAIASLVALALIILVARYVGARYSAPSMFRNVQGIASALLPAQARPADA